MVDQSQNSLLTKTQIAKRERSAMRFWVCVICGFFAIDFIVAAVAISMAAGDPSFRSIPGYGERAVAWDVRQGRKRSSQDLQWKVTVQRAEPRRDAIEILIRNAANEPVTGCTGVVRMFHFTRVADQHRGEIVETEPGTYRANIDVSKPGRWQLDLEIHADGDRNFWDEQIVNWFDDSVQGVGTAP